jgi:hypothetical protein
MYKIYRETLEVRADLVHGWGGQWAGVVQHCTCTKSPESPTPIAYNIPYTIMHKFAICVSLPYSISYLSYSILIKKVFKGSALPYKNVAWWCFLWPFYYSILYSVK